MIIAFQILMLLILFFSGILAMGSSDAKHMDKHELEIDQQKSNRSARIFGMTLAAFLITLFLLEGGIL